VILEDENGAVELGVFDSEDSQGDGGLKEGDVVVIECTVMHDKDKKDSAIRVKKLETIVDFRARKNARIEIDVTHGEDPESFLNLMREEVSGDLDGKDCGVTINYKNKHYSTLIALDNRWRFSPTEEFLARMEDQMGLDSIRIRYPSR
jgi:DNA polymerase III alpha subunit